MYKSRKIWIAALVGSLSLGIPRQIIAQSHPSGASTTSATQPLTDSVGTYGKIYSNVPVDGDWRTFLTAAVEKYRGTEIEDDCRLLLAGFEHSKGRKNDAFVELAALAKDRTATLIHFPNSGWGDLPDRWKPVAELINTYLSRYPDHTADQATLDLDEFSYIDGHPDKFWVYAEQLRALYPEGDRIRELNALLDALHKEVPSLPVRPSADPSSSYIFSPLRSPHMRALLGMAAYCELPEFRDKFRPSSRECAKILCELIDRYGRLLTAKELRNFAAQGAAEVKRTREAKNGEKDAQLDTMDRTFTAAAKEAAEAPADKDSLKE